MANALFIAMRMQRDEVQKRQNRDGRENRRDENIARRIVVLLIHVPLLRRGLRRAASRDKFVRNASAFAYRTTPT
jgi:hypothetical protein